VPLLAVSDSLSIAGWIVIGPLAAAWTTFLASRLLGVRRGWLAMVMSGLFGWTLGVITAGALASWQWSTVAMVALAFLFGTLFTMMAAVGLDLLAPVGSLRTGSSAGRIAVTNPLAGLRRALQPFARYRELGRIARRNGLTRANLRRFGNDHLDETGPALRRTLEEAGGMFVKLGQVASTRSDLLPADLCDELAKLQSGAAPAPEDQMRPLIEHELGGAVETRFATFDWTPLASASIAQVYAATLPDGAEVVVKVQRPHLDQIIERDSAALLQVADVLERYTTLGLAMKPRELADEFVAGVAEELDFRVEASNGLALAAATPPESGVRIPGVYPELSTGRLLVEERVHGIGVGDADALRANGVDPRQVAERLLQVMFQQLFEGGTFHADPHPGNVLIEDDGTVVLIDLGAVGHLSRQQRNVMTELVVGATRADGQMVRQALDDAGMLDGGDTSELELSLEVFLARHVQPGGGLDGSLFQDLVGLLVANGLRPPQWMATLGRTMVTLEGTLKTLDPDFSLFSSAESMARVQMQRAPSVASLRDAMAHEAMTQLPRLRRAPQRVDEILRQASRGRLRARVSLFSEQEDLDAITRLVNRVVMGLIAAALGLGSVMLLGVSNDVEATAGSVNEVLGYVGLALSAILLLRLIAAIVRDGKL